MAATKLQLDDLRAVVVDIEGTTSPTAAVHGALFADARANLEPWLRAHAAEPEVATALGDARSEAGLAADAPLDDVIAALRAWIDEDRKSTPLKTIEGGIWAEGFAAGRLRAEFFDDVAEALVRWHRAGARLAVFSSGAVTVQRPWFAAAGLGELVGDHYDTVNAGPKKEPAAYRRIADDLGARYGYRPGEIAFLSDVPAELDAAAEAGLRAVGVARPGEPYGEADFGPHPTVDSFATLDVTVPADPTPAEARAAGRALAAEAARLAAFGWMRATSGNLSTVLRRDPLRLAVTASGVDKGELGDDDVVVVDRDALAVDVAGLAPRKPTAEALLHATIAETTGAGAVIHVHALGAAVAGERWPHGVPIERVEMVKAFGHDADGTAVVPVIDNSQSMAELGERFAEAYDPRVPAVIVARHGLYVWGDDLRQARHHVEGVEWALEFVVASNGTAKHTGEDP